MTTSLATDSSFMVTQPVSLPPYRGPLPTMASDARMPVGPYVPAGFRTVSASSVTADEALLTATDAITANGSVVDPGQQRGVDDDVNDLPWIDQFLTTTPATAANPIAGVPDAYRYATPAMSLEALTEVDSDLGSDLGSEIGDAADITADITADVTADMAADITADMAADAAMARAAADEWPMSETSDALGEITREFEDDRPADVASARLFGDAVVPRPLPAWSDTDLMNIMPVREPSPPHGLAAAASEGAGEATGTHGARADDAAQAAAQALEVLAQRVRAGELQLPGYDPRMGDAAALVSALAALLGLRLG